MKFFYQLIILFLTANFIWHLFREKKFWNQMAAGLVLIMFLLRFFLIK